MSHHRPTLSQRLLIHADNMQGEGWYTTANVLAEAAQALGAAKEILDFLESIEGHGYGGMAAFEIARMHARTLALTSGKQGDDHG